MSDKISVSQMREVLRHAMGENSDIIFATAQLFTFASRVDIELSVVHKAILDALVEAAGPDRTVVMPAFCFSYGKTRRVDFVRDKPSTGILVEEAIARKWARTDRPMFSWVAKGPRAAEMAEQVQTTAFGGDSVLAWLSRYNARALGLGITSGNFGWTIVHQAEESLQVPYRYYKKFPGRAFYDGEDIGYREEISFVQPLHVSLNNDFSCLTERLREKGELWVNQDPLFPLRAVDGSAALRESIGALESDIFSFVTNKDEALRWISTLREKELSDMAEEDRYSPAIG